MPALFQDRHPGAQSQIVEYLLQNGAQWDFRDECARQPLHYSIIFSRPDLAKSFLPKRSRQVLSSAEANSTPHYRMKCL